MMALSVGIEPASEDPESPILSVELRERRSAEGTGFEPVKGLIPRVFETRAVDRWANPPQNCAHPSGVEPPTVGTAIQCSIH